MELGIGKRIKKRRTELGLTQGELAERMGYKSKAAICKVENGEDNITSDRVSKFAEALGCSPAYLMGWQEQSNINENTFNSIFAKNLRTYLEMNHMTQAELSKKLDVGTTSVYNWCNGIKIPRMDKVDKMCEIFGCKRSDLITDSVIMDDRTKDFIDLFQNAPQEYQDAAFLLLKSAPREP